MSRWGRWLMLVMAMACGAPMAQEHKAEPQATIRFATFNVSMYREAPGALVQELTGSGSEQVRNVAEIIQRAAPDVLLLNEFDYDAGGEALRLFRERFLEVSQHGAPPIHYEYAYAAPSNTGVPSGLDLNGDGKTNTADDALGFGQFPGQYAFAILSRFPLRVDQLRSFQQFLWKDMPQSLLPQDFYDEQKRAVLRLSSKNHVDLPVVLPDGRTVHLLASHPTPPSFDGPEDRNGRRNADEIRLWADYISPGQGDYLLDDHGGSGGLTAEASFVVMGDMNADPNDGDAWPGAMKRLLDSPRIQPAVAYGDLVPKASGGVSYGRRNPNHHGDPAADTAAFAGGLRVDYVLPSGNLQPLASGIFWPDEKDPLAYLVAWPEGGEPASSDHHLVWVDIQASP